MSPKKKSIFAITINRLILVAACLVILSENVTGQQAGQQSVNVTTDKTGEQNQQEQLFSLSIDDAQIKDVLEALAYQANLSLVLPEEITGSVSLRLKNVTWQTALNAVLQAGRYVATEKEDVLFISLPEEIPIEQADPLITETFNLDFANAKDTEKTVKNFLSRRGKMGIDERLNRIVVIDTAENLELTRQALQKLDVKAPQVMIEALIINVKLTDELKMGVDWTKLGTLNNYFSQDLSVTGSVNPFGQITFSKTSGAWSFAGLIDFIETHDNVKILASPKVLVLNNHTATIDAVEEIPYRELTQTASGGSIGTTSFKQAGIRLEVTPQISDDGYVIMHVKPEQSAQTGTFTVDGSQTPIIETRKTETTLRVKNGQTIIIGGLRKKRPSIEESKIPILGDIPWIGALFRKLDKEQTESELGVFITPYIYTEGELSADQLKLLNSIDTSESLLDPVDLLKSRPND